jgi:PAS domain S-box-containing protein
MKYYTLQKVILIIVVSFLIIVCIALASFFFINKMIHASNQRTQTNLVLFTSERVRTLSTELIVLQLENVLIKNDSSIKKNNLQVSNSILSEIQFLDSITSQQPVPSDKTRQVKIEVEKEIELLNKISQRNSADTIFSSRSQSNKVISELLDAIQEDANIEKREILSSLTDEFYKFAFILGGLLTLWLGILTALTFAIRNNLTLQKKTELKMSRISAENLDLYQNAPCGYFTINEEGILTNANGTLLSWLGYEKQEVVDRSHFENLFVSNSFFFNDEILVQLKEKGVLNSLELEAKRKDGSLFPVIVDAFAIINNSGKLVSSRYTLADNTKRKQAETEILQSNKELDAFTYSVSHDLRAPLRSVNGYAQILKEDYKEKLDEEGNRVIDIIVKNGKRMGQLIDDLLEFSRTSKKEIAKSHVSMNDYVCAIATDLMEAEKNRQVQWNLLPLGPSLVDVSMMRQVWVNLLSNAMKYSRKNELTAIEVGSSETDYESIYYVKDNGVGFDMKYYSKLFGVFQRLHKAEDFDGTGVGLALVKRVIERHNGRIWAESKIGEGATFFFSIPKISETRTRQSANQ